MLEKTTSALARSIKEAGILGQLYIMDNSDSVLGRNSEFIENYGLNVLYIRQHGTIGYGMGHNLAIALSHAQSILVY